MARQGDGSVKPPPAAAPEDPTTDKTLDGQSLSFGAHSVGTGKEALGDTIDSEPGRRPTPLPLPSHVSSNPSRVTVNPFPVAQWDRYEFQKLLGQGGMGAVYQARDRRLDRLVALKFIRNTDEGQVQRFMQEARAQSRIDHPGVCKVHEVGEVDGKAYIAMQFIDGVSLQQAARGMSMLDRVTVIRDAAVALHAAHELSIIHRDIKPAKVTSVEKAGSVVRTPSLISRTKLDESSAGWPFSSASTALLYSAHACCQSHASSSRVEQRQAGQLLPPSGHFLWQSANSSSAAWREAAQRKNSIEGWTTGL